MWGKQAKFHLSLMCQKSNITHSIVKILSTIQTSANDNPGSELYSDIHTHSMVITDQVHCWCQQKEGQRKKSVRFKTESAPGANLHPIQLTTTNTTQCYGWTTFSLWDIKDIYLVSLALWWSIYAHFFLVKNHGNVTKSPATTSVTVKP